MQYRAMIKQTHGWWIGWLVDLPGGNAQEKAQKMLETNVPFEPGFIMEKLDVPEPEWA